MGGDRCRRHAERELRGQNRAERIHLGGVAIAQLIFRLGGSIICQVDVPVSLYGHLIHAKISAIDTGNVVGTIWKPTRKGFAAGGSLAVGLSSDRELKVSLQANSVDELTDDLLMIVQNLTMRLLDDS